MTDIINNKIDKILSEKYLAYAISTIVSRSLPDGRDGLKPVHRRIIYSMYQLKLLNDSPYKKSARIVGDVMGKFHPHGDQAIYDSLVRMAQNFSTRMTLIDGQGNFGNIDGDNPAAMRYTEARLEKITKYFFDGIEENSVPFKENYDGQNLEPVVLPTQLPNLLLNGATGIAVGMATNIPPHNIYELNDCIIELIKNPSIKTGNLLKYLDGPDLPTGGEIILSPEEKKQIYLKGKGSFIINSKWHKESLKNGIYQIIISEIPYQVNKTKIIEQFANLINQKKIPIEDIVDESDENIRIVLKPKNRNINSERLMELCFKLTDLSIKYSCNFNVLEKGIVPKQFGLKDLLLQFIEHRKISIKRKSEFNIKKIKTRLEILEGFLIVYKNLNKIINIIRTKENPKKEIIKKYKITNNQADAILGMRLGSLKKLDEINTKKEIKDLKDEMKYLNKLIKDKRTLNEFFIKDLKKINLEINKDIAKRKTNISKIDSTNENITFEEFKEIEKLTIIVNKHSEIKRIKDHSNITELIKKDSSINLAININSNQKVLIFLSSGRVFTLDPYIFPGGKSHPKSFIYFIEAATNEKLIGITSVENEKKVILVSLNGKGFISEVNNITTNHKKGKQVFNLKNDDLVLKVIDYDKTHIACVTKAKKMLIFDLKSLPSLQKGGGVQLIKIKNKDCLSDISLLNLNDGLKWYSGSKNRRLDDINFWMGKRAQTGRKIPKYFNKNLKFIS